MTDPPTDLSIDLSTALPTDHATKADPPLLRVVRGDPAPEELAAVVAVLAVATSAAPAETEPARGQWSARGRNVRPALSHGPDAWRASGMPR